MQRRIDSSLDSGYAVRVILALAWLTPLPVLPGAVHGQDTASTADPLADLPADLPAWVHDVGAREVPRADRTCAVSDYGARPDTLQTSTRAIQQAIDACAEGGGGATP